MKRRTVLIAAHLVGLAVIIWIISRGCGKKPAPSAPGAAAPTTASTTTAVVEVPVVPVTPSAPLLPPELAKPARPAAAAPAPSSPSLPPPPVEAPPPVKIYKELIPRNIEIVRVYYESSLTGPASSIEFDINGSGFNVEFERMIKVESGSPDVSVSGLRLVTPNQIHGRLNVSSKTPTGIYFPQVLINEKIVFRAPEPFGVIRPNEVLKMFFTEMGESGRTGRFRVLTNLTPEAFAKLKIQASTAAIEFGGFAPALPFVVDGTLNIGRADGGSYGMTIELDGKLIWNADGIIRVVKPNVGQTGLVQRLQTVDGFHRPGDTARFTLLGSGFQPQDVDVLIATVPGWTALKSTFTYAAPGRMDLAIEIPLTAETTAYGIRISQGDEVLLNNANSFMVVGRNWARMIRVEPALVPGGDSELVLTGRDLSPEFVTGLKVDADEPGLEFGSFAQVSASEARARVSAGPGVAAGDYLLTITSGGRPVSPQFGSIIRVEVRR